MRCEEKTRQRMRKVAPICNSCQDCEDLLSITPPQSVKIQQYIRHLETEGISRVKMYMIITAAYLIFWAPLFLVSWEATGHFLSSSAKRTFYSIKSHQEIKTFLSQNYKTNWVCL